MEANKRAQRIARTETSAALNAGQQVQVDVLEAAGLVIVKTWTSVGDADVRESHAAKNGHQVRGKENFELSGHLIPYPAHWSLPAQERVRCRCDIYTDELADVQGGFV
ncbi:MAG: phage minor head protein [Thermoguttaceae bacterium]